MSYLELAPRDREKWGLPERIEFDGLSSIGFRSFHAMEVTTGFKLHEATALAFDGVIKLVGGEEQIQYNSDALAAVLWVICYAAGYKIPWDQFAPSPAGMKLDLR